MWTYGIYVFLALAVLAKGPVGAVLAGLSMAIFVLITRRWDLLKRLLQPGPMVSGLAVALPWYWLCYRANGWSSPRIYDPQQRRAVRHGSLSTVQSSGSPYGVLAGFRRGCPSSVPRAMVRRQGESPKDLRLALFWAWALLPILVFLCRNQAARNVLPVFPPLALLAAENGIDFGVQTRKRGFRRDSA